MTSNFFKIYSKRNTIHWIKFLVKSFSWPCLHQWLETRPTRQVCPVCKAAISKEKVIPLYGRGATKQEDPRNNVPPRPAGQRSEPEGNSFSGVTFGDGGFHMSFGIGAFPFGFFTSTFNFGETRTRIGKALKRLLKKINKKKQKKNLQFLNMCKASVFAAPDGTPQYEEDQFMSKLFLWLALIFIGWLLMA